MGFMRSLKNTFKNATNFKNPLKQILTVTDPITSNKGWRNNFEQKGLTGITDALGITHYADNARQRELLAAQEAQAKAFQDQMDQMAADAAARSALDAANSNKGVATIEAGGDVGSSDYFGDAGRRKKAATSVSSALGLTV